MIDLLKWMKYKLSFKRQLKALVYLTVCALLLLNLFYYLSFNRLTTQRAEEYFTTIFDLMQSRIETVVHNFDLVTQSIFYNKTLQRYLTSADEEETESVRPFVENLFMEAILSQNQGMEQSAIVGVRLVGRDSVSATQSDTVDRILDQIEKDYRLSVSNYFNSLYTRAYLNPKTGIMYYGYIQPIRQQPQNDSSASLRLGYCVYLCSAGTIQELMRSVRLPTNATVFLYDYDNRVIASTESSFTGRFLPSVLEMNISLSELSREMQPVQINHTDYLSKMAVITSAEWRMLLIIPTKDLIADMNPIRIMGFSIGVAAVILVLLLGSLMVRGITGQVGSLTTEMARVDSYGANYRISTGYSNEISVIAEQINIMLERVEESAKEALNVREKLYENELAKKHAEMYALQSQIYPHFLYNTLECIRSIALYRGVEEICCIATSMGNIFRYCVSPGESVTLEDEINCVNEYFKIIHIRFEGKMSLVLEIPEIFYSRKILKMILQPVVENAMYHGLERVSRPGTLRIRAEESEGDFILTVYDNGGGMTPEQYKAITAKLADHSILMGGVKSSGIGLANIQSRMKITYGDRYGVQVYSEQGKGTTVKLVMPAETVE